ncbi:hypothetical protein OESDEN_02049 [Oesophagostomum dentatum]|uniref:Uncharacterized protein n=1 Tax=Oesophagostomum dentatum TaxID=61180 RepID=A0A0B1TPD2_OESDE|nr:hypothetical protein OESDEN_02049 [Oesophagostomum dentatum]
MSFTYEDMQWIAVHHLLHNEIVLNNNIFMNYLDRESCYFPMLKNVLETHEAAVFEDEEGLKKPEAAGNEDGLEKFLGKIRQLQERTENCQGMTQGKADQMCKVLLDVIDKIDKKLEKVTCFLYTVDTGAYIFVRRFFLRSLRGGTAGENLPRTFFLAFIKG